MGLRGFILGGGIDLLSLGFVCALTATLCGNFCKFGAPALRASNVSRCMSIMSTSPQVCPVPIVTVFSSMLQLYHQTIQL